MNFTFDKLLNAYLSRAGVSPHNYPRRDENLKFSLPEKEISY